ncbi:galactoside alpha-(1,2)-fucosyltransferase 2-like isoform X1 [Mytilus edulis]|uniref:galactoside alpha-(1,2)-fucosyltransferase 2-like isoform X1 n=1 Tax=Mytilus edulis TaxID=6550 RepID=UPI0039EEFCDD
MNMSIKLNGKTSIRYLFTVAALFCVYYIYLYFSRCGKILFNDLIGKPRPNFFCVNFVGGLANHMFQYAFGYAMAESRNSQLIVQRTNMITQYFDISSNTFEDHGYNSETCWCFRTRENDKNCGYDEGMDRLPLNDLSIIGYVQSWKYWRKNENKVRKLFTFNDNITTEAQNQLRSILTQKNIKITQDQVIVGVHIRNGDYTRTFGGYGYNIAPKEYIFSAMKYFKEKFINPFFIVCTNEVIWTKRVLSGMTDVYISEGNSAPVDMALLSLTNHTIMTVGTYGWMVAWLTRGITIYYKYPYVQGSEFASQFHSNYSDHFYPGWIAME